MTVLEILKFGAEILKTLSKNEVKLDDFRYIDLYEDYLKMKKENQKVSYIVSILSEKYKVSEASVYRILRRFGKAVKT